MSFGPPDLDHIEHPLERAIVACREATDGRGLRVRICPIDALDPIAWQKALDALVNNLRTAIPMEERIAALRNLELVTYAYRLLLEERRR